MIPVKSISQLQPFKNQQESLIQFENFNTDSTIIGLNRYSISAENFDEALFAGDLKDNDMFIEVSYLDPEKKTYVPRKFDFSNYLKYIEDALSVLNNGILGVYLTEARADDLYVKKRGDTMFGPLGFDLTDNSRTSYPIWIDDKRSVPTQGYISIKGTNSSGIKISTNNKDNAIELNGSTPSLKIDNVFNANVAGNLVEIKKPLTIGGNTEIYGTLSVQNNLSANDAFCKNITLQSSVRANSLTGNSLTITNVLTATTSNVTINKATTINNILTAATDSVHIAKPTTIDSTLTITGDTFTISNANAKIQFGTTTDAKSSLSYNTTSKAFVMSGLIIQPENTTSRITTADSVNLETETDSLVFALRVNGNSLYEGSMFGEQAIRAEKFVTEEFEANKITALNKDNTGGFIQKTGISDLTAKRACWA